MDPLALMEPSGKDGRWGSSVKEGKPNEEEKTVSAQHGSHGC